MTCQIIQSQVIHLEEKVMSFFLDILSLLCASFRPEKVPFSSHLPIQTVTLYSQNASKGNEMTALEWSGFTPYMKLESFLLKFIFLNNQFSSN